MPNAHYDVIVLGAGAAGLMCAIEAGKRGRRVAVIEHAAEIGKKILISGGGRCNFTNLHCHPDRFISANPHFCKSALARYTPADFVALVRKHRIPYHEKTMGQLFCDRSARDIIQLLRHEIDAANAVVFTGCAVTAVRRTTEFVLDTSRGAFHTPALVVATGGLSIPKIGATDFGYRLAREFGIRIADCRPALVPLVLPDEERRAWCDLSGVSAGVVASAGDRRFTEKMLFTHRGLSGPAILQISSYWRKPEGIAIDLLPGVDIESQILDRKKGHEPATPKSVLSEHLPRRLAERWMDRHGVSKPLTQWTDDDLRRLAAGLHAWRLHPSGTEGYEKAEVTAGGVDTGELSSRTFECRNVPGLYFIGEVVDVTGHLGGFNFQWAWASGYAAGTAL